jgi:hypothetical protein
VKVDLSQINLEANPNLSLSSFLIKGEKRGDHPSGAGPGGFPAPRALCSSAVEKWPDPALGSV